MKKNYTLQEMIDFAGSISALAKTLQCSRTIIYAWDRKEPIPQPWLDALRYRRPEWFTNS